MHPVRGIYFLHVHHERIPANVKLYTRIYPPSPISISLALLLFLAHIYYFRVRIRVLMRLALTRESPRRMCAHRSRKALVV